MSRAPEPPKRSRLQTPPKIAKPKSSKEDVKVTANWSVVCVGDDDKQATIDALKSKVDAYEKSKEVLEDALRRYSLQTEKEKANSRKLAAELAEARNDALLASQKFQTQIAEHEDRWSTQCEQVRLLQQDSDALRAQLLAKDVELRVLHNENIDLKDQGTTMTFKVFHFEAVLQQQATQADVYDAAKELILSAIHGYNVTLIAFGQTGSGKTHTMRGGDADAQGVIPRALNHLFDTCQGELRALGWEFQLSASFVEVYNEDVYDLLDDRKKVDVKLVGNAVNTSGLSVLPINCAADAEKILNAANSQRSTASTKLNDASSRSHAVFTVLVQGRNCRNGNVVHSRLSMVDLAGSERVKESGAVGDRFNEMTHINQSLGTLKRCLRALKTKQSHVPYRESKLTTLLSESLGGGSSKCMFIMHVNPDDVVETKRTLDFSADVRATKLGVVQPQTTHEANTFDANSALPVA